MTKQNPNYVQYRDRRKSTRKWQSAETTLDGRTDGRTRLYKDSSTDHILLLFHSRLATRNDKQQQQHSGGRGRLEEQRAHSSPLLARPPPARPERVPPEHLKLPHARKYAAAAPTNGSPLDWQ